MFAWFETLTYLNSKMSCKFEQDPIATDLCHRSEKPKNEKYQADFIFFYFLLRNITLFSRDYNTYFNVFE